MKCHICNYDFVYKDPRLDKARQMQADLDAMLKKANDIQRQLAEVEERRADVEKRTDEHGRRLEEIRRKVEGLEK